MSFIDDVKRRSAAAVLEGYACGENPRDAYDDIAKLLELVQVYETALDKIKAIRRLPLTDIHDTDRERAEQYSSVIDTLVYRATQSLTEGAHIKGEKL